MNDIRDKPSKGERVHCKNCWKMEDRDILIALNRPSDYGYEPRESYVENVKQYMDTEKYSLMSH